MTVERRASITARAPERVHAATPSARAWVALAVLMLPVLLVSIDATVLSLALPHIARSLHPDAAQQLWILDAYSVVLAGLLVTMGGLGDRIGRRRLLLVGAVGFAACSVASAFAPSAGWLIALRAATGVFGATLMPATLALIRDLFPDRERRRVAVAVWAACFSAGTAAGPLVGGLLLERLPWGSVFLIAVPMLVPLLALAPLLVPESRDPRPGPVDVPGMLASMATLGGFVLGVKELAAGGAVVPAVAAIATSGLAGWWFVRRMRRATRPLLDLALLHDPRFAGSVVINLLSVTALVGFLYFASQHLQLVLGLDALDAALVLLPGILLSIVAGLAIVRPAATRSVRGLMAGALLCSAAAYALVAVAGAGSGWTLTAVAFCLLGAGVGAADTMSNDLILSAAPPERAGAASAISETAYEVGAVLGTALLGGLLTAHHRIALVVPDGVPADAAARARETLAGAGEAALGLPPETGAALWEAATNAFEGGVVVTASIGAALMATAAAIAWRVLPDGSDHRRRARLE
ncbi:MFS transporter [Pseudoclavibacter caeni]|jgi:DHA2 family multidrug resistance protein-like MFS transporter|uniref:MFS transporter n=1 Tax=Pseudoclavibacter caeni TaxID=908846 RepID=A0A7C8FWQ6_9MICO|nr:MFS transporter [Pseudoclavibacter caeni]KAB1631516.1 MFS transporter [Pseudoclavibacter caeni]NYJ97846.1 DHA2 family multidrug resistance protein-like MFS transporter [Pseudoclavibacter caeni]